MTAPKADATDGLDAALADLARRRALVTYGALAARLGLSGPGRIARLTAALEATMTEDAALGHALRAAQVVSRLGGDLPAQGFFQHAAALGLLPPVADPDTARIFHRQQLEGLWQEG
ncbi:MAG: hypothetical protein JJT99_14295 [Rhodobacteraceae bacterium]|nr:hypothetical protein [Paracoccaceae bacterium]